MQKEKNKKRKISKKTMERIRYNLVLIGLTAVLLIVSTYSWFITLNDLTIDTFQIDVRTDEGLKISFDGVNFTNELTLSKDLMESYYFGNINQWPYEGLIPVSTSGVMDTNTNKLKFYSKRSLLSSNGGYRLTTSDINLKKDEKGYLVFDLFFKNNIGGDKYQSSADADGESISLKKNSYVRIETDEEARSRVGPGEEVPKGGDGIENGIRVAFMQIGRVNKEASTNAIIGMKCKDETIDGYKVTNLCNKERIKTWNIWEPNDNRHTYKSKNFFDTACRRRTGIDSYSGYCNFWETNQHVDTYAVNDKITSKDYINVYDGLNGYNNYSNKLKKMTYFTDSVDKANDETLFEIGINSITKVRVYVYLEGQDVDTLDYIKLEKRIKMALLFSKGDIFDEE